MLAYERTTVTKALANLKRAYDEAKKAYNRLLTTSLVEVESPIGNDCWASMRSLELQAKRLEQILTDGQASDNQLNLSLSESEKSNAKEG